MACAVSAAQLAVRERIDAADRVPGGGTPADIRRLEDALTAAGGGRLRDAIRRDESGAARALLDRALWAPDLDAAVRLQPLLPLGWLVVTRDGGAVLDPFSVRIGRGESPLEARAEGERLAREAAALEHEAAEAQRDLGVAEAAVGVARAALDRARASEFDGLGRPAPGRGGGAHRRPRARGERPRGRVAARPGRSARDGAGAFPCRPGRPAKRRRPGNRRPRAARRRAATPTRSPPGSRASASSGRDAIAWRPRPRPSIACVATPRPGVRARSPPRRWPSAGSRSRTATWTRSAPASRRPPTSATAVAGAIAEAKAQESRAREALEALLADDRVERGRLADAERAATTARERLRVTDDRARASDVAAMEARLNLESLREQVLVELAGMGEVGLRHLAEASGVELAAEWHGGAVAVRGLSGGRGGRERHR